jgi:hypothetical protein
MLPQPSHSASQIITPPQISTTPTDPRIVVHQQFINTVHGIVAHEMSGTANMNPDAAEILSLISEFGGNDKALLESSVHELEDDDARHSDRLAARQRLKGFLVKAGDKIGNVGFAVLQKYLENKVIGS